MNDYKDLSEGGPTWVWAYAETHGMEITRKFNIIDYKQKGEEI